MKRSTLWIVALSACAGYLLVGSIGIMNKDGVAGAIGATVAFVAMVTLMWEQLK
jgi:hypothetical protein